MHKPEIKFHGYSEEMSDFPMVDMALAGNQSAYEYLFKKYREKIFRFFMRSTKNNIADSEDLAQNTFASAFSKLHTFKKNASFYTWLRRIAINVFLMSCRHKKLRLVSIEELQGQQVTNEGLIVEALYGNKRMWSDRKSEIGKLDRALENVPNEISVNQLMRDLPPGYKKMLELYDLQGLEYNEIAAKLRCSPGNAKSQRHRAITRLREAAQIAHT